MLRYTASLLLVLALLDVASSWASFQSGSKPSPTTTTTRPPTTTTRMKPTTTTTEKPTTTTTEKPTTTTTEKPTTLTTTAGKGCKPMIDLLIILDESASVGNRLFNEARKFLGELLLVMGQNTRVALIEYASDVSLAFPFNKYKQTIQRASALFRLKRRGYSATYTGKALKYARKKVLGKRHLGDRPEARNVVITVTDGASNDRQLTVDESAKLRRLGYTTYAIGIGTGIGLDELKAIGGQTDHVFTTHAGQMTRQLAGIIGKRMCNIGGQG